VDTRRDAAACTRCPLHRHATQTVFGRGDVDAPLMFVGEQPGDQEDLRGLPFVGPSGALFERALAAARIERAQVYVTNAVKHFKFELRGQRRIHKTAAQQEAAACLGWLEREIALVRPRAIVALGATAARSLLGRAVAVTRERGKWLPRADGIPVLVALHPAALLRLADAQREAAIGAWFEDFLAAAGKVRFDR
jgi:uracil-DNA glycosylase family protein